MYVYNTEKYRIHNYSMQNICLSQLFVIGISISISITVVTIDSCTQGFARQLHWFIELMFPVKLINYKESFIVW